MSTTEVVLHPEVIEFKGPRVGPNTTYLSMWSDGSDGFVFSKNVNRNLAPGSYLNKDPLVSGVIKLHKACFGATADNVGNMDGVCVEDETISQVQQMTFKPNGDLNMNMGNVSNISQLSFWEGLTIYKDDISNVNKLSFGSLSDNEISLNDGNIVGTNKVDFLNGMVFDTDKMSNVSELSFKDGLVMTPLNIEMMGGNVENVDYLKLKDGLTLHGNQIDMLFGNISNLDMVEFAEGMVLRKDDLSNVHTITFGAQPDNQLDMADGNVVNVHDLLFTSGAKIVDNVLSIDQIRHVTGPSVNVMGTVFTSNVSDPSSNVNAAIDTDSINMNRFYCDNEDLPFNNKRISNVAKPVNLGDVVTLQYLRENQDRALEGLKPKEAVVVSTTPDDISAISIHRGFSWSNVEVNEITYPDGNVETLPPGVLTVVDSSNISFDGVEVNVGDRVLIKDFESATSDTLTGTSLKSLNGIWMVKEKTTISAGALTSQIKLRRSIDMNEDHELMNNSYVYVKQGTLNKDIGFVVANPDPITLVDGLTISNIDEATSSLTDDIVSFVQFNDLASTLNSWVRIEDGVDTDDAEVSENSNWQGRNIASGSSRMSSGALLLRAYGDSKKHIAMDADYLCFNRSFMPGGRYNDANLPDLQKHALSYATYSFYYQESDPTYNNGNVDSFHSNADIHNWDEDYVLTVKGHIVLEATSNVVTGENHASTINKVEFGAAGDMYTNGNVEALTLTAHSDARLKKNVKDIEQPLDLVDKFRGVTFNWKSDEQSARTEYGFIAQEVEEHFPTLVQQHPNSGIKSVDYMKVCSILCSAVSELTQKVKDLEAKLA